MNLHRILCYALNLNLESKLPLIEFPPQTVMWDQFKVICMVRYEGFGKRLDQYQSLLNVRGYFEKKGGEIVFSLDRAEKVTIPSYETGLEVELDNPSVHDCDAYMPAKDAYMQLRPAFEKLQVNFSSQVAPWTWSGVTAAIAAPGSPRSSAGPSASTVHTPNSCKKVKTEKAGDPLTSALRQELQASGSGSSVAKPPNQ